MSKNDPLILDFETDSGNTYVYDAVTNRVFFTPPPMAEMIKGHKEKDREQMISELSGRYPVDVLNDYYDQIRRWVEIDKAFFLDEPYVEPSPSVELDRHRRRTCRRPHLILTVTNDCNLACRYCIQEKTRESLTFTVAKAGIDRFYEYNANPHEKAMDSVSIGFYGGEPLLELDLMRRCVDYVKAEMDWPLPCMYFMTTNGTLLTDEVADFLVENDFHIAVSLDGPKEEHDRNRITRAGSGTFDLILANLQRLKERHPVYFDTRTSVLATFDLVSDVRRILDWFQENGSTLPRLMRLSLAGVSEATCNRFPCDTLQNFQLRQKDLYAAIKRVLTEDLSQDMLHTPWTQFLGPQMSLMLSRRHTHVALFSRVGCWPGVSRLTLRPDGTFHVCERIESRYSIGDVQTGIDPDKVNKIVGDYLTQVVAGNNCHACMAQHLCQACYVNTIGGFAKSFSCERERAAVKGELQYWYSILEKQPRLTQHFRPHPQTILDRTL